MAEQAIKIGFMIGITGPVTFQNGARLRNVVAELPVKHLLIETDSPFLTPVPYRGQRNEPARVLHVAEKIGELHSMDLDQIAEITTQNSERLFRW